MHAIYTELHICWHVLNVPQKIKNSAIFEAKPVLEYEPTEADG